MIAEWEHKQEEHFIYDNIKEAVEFFHPGFDFIGYEDCNDPTLYNIRVKHKDTGIFSNFWMNKQNNLNFSRQLII